MLSLRDRLIANDFIQVRKVAEHVYDKVLGAGSDSGSVTGGNTVSSGSPAGDRTNTDSNADNSSLAEEKVELLCNDQVLDPSMDLRTVCIKLSKPFVIVERMFYVCLSASQVRHFIWKSSADLTLHYRPVK